MKRILYSLSILLFLFAVSYTVNGQGVVVKKTDNETVIGGNKYYLHEVSKNETLFSICKAYGISVKDVMRINKKTEPFLSIKEKLMIPQNLKKGTDHAKTIEKEDNNFFYHIIKEGETLYSLSKQYQLELDVIVKINPRAKNYILVGDTLKIPKVKKIAKKEVPEYAKKDTVEYDKEETEIPEYDKKYYYHKVRAGETDLYIANEYGIKLRKLRKLNPHIKNAKRLKKGVKIRIPLNLLPEQKLQIADIKTVEKDSLFISEIFDIDSVEDKVKIALLLPLYLKINDSINNIYSYRDTVKIVTKRNPQVIYSKSRNFIRFYQGVLMAIDTLKKQGISIDLYVYDTEKSEDKVREILTKPELLNVDIIVGPAYSNTFALAADFALNNKIPIISPLLYAKNPKLRTNPFVFQVNTSTSTLCDKITDYVGSSLKMTEKNNTEKNIVVIHEEDKYENLNEYKLVSNIEQYLFAEEFYWRDDKLHYKKISFDEYGLRGIKHALCDSCENIILIPSIDQPIVSNIITNLNILSRQYRIRLVGFPLWQRYSSIECESFYKLNTTLLSPYYIDYQADKTKEFVARFRENFEAEPVDFSFRAYDICTYFTKAINRFGDDFINNINENNKDGLLQGEFNFNRAGVFGGLENDGLHLINYGKDFRIHHQKSSK